MDSDCEIGKWFDYLIGNSDDPPLAPPTDGNLGQWNRSDFDGDIYVNETEIRKHTEIKA